MSGREVCGILEQHGFSIVRQRGSHVVMQKHAEGKTITVPVPDINFLPLIVLGELRAGFAAGNQESTNAANLQRFLNSPRVSF